MKTVFLVCAVAVMAFLVAPVEFGLSSDAYAQAVSAVPEGSGDVTLPVTEVVSEPSLLGEWWQALWADLKGPLITLVVGVVMFFVRKYVNANAAQVLQQMIQGAAERAAGVAAAEHPNVMLTGTVIGPNSPAVVSGVKYMEKTMAQKIEKAEKSGGEKLPLADFVMAQLGRLKAGAPAAKPG